MRSTLPNAVAVNRAELTANATVAIAAEHQTNRLNRVSTFSPSE
jgi:hypothetical protein